MTREELIRHLADEARARVKSGQSKNYTIAIRYVCGGSISLKSAVGKALNKRGQVKKMIQEIKKREAAQLKPEQGRLF